MLNLSIKLLVAYLVGNIMGGDVLRILFGGPDLRLSGSGNVGATNALRTQGFGYAAGVLTFDVTKGALVTSLLPFLDLSGLDIVPLSPRVVACICAGIVALGHCYPVFHRFRGGKGVATLVGIFGVLVPTAVILGLLGFVLILLLTGYVSLSSLIAAAVAVIWIAVGFPDGIGSPEGQLALCMMALVVLKHRTNIVRLISHTESRFERARVLGRVADKWIHH